MMACSAAKALVQETGAISHRNPRDAGRQRAIRKMVPTAGFEPATP